jgi:transketolase
MMKSLRQAYGETLVELGKDNPKIVVLEADLGKSTMSVLFQNAYPERYFEMGIAEQNMASTAAGLALTGKIAFINSFAVFSTGRCYDQLRQTIAIASLNVKICGSSSGLSDFGDGSTHQSVEDMALMRAIPNMTVLVPVDAVETAKMVRAMASHPGPVYIRINRADLPVITDENGEFRIGDISTVRDGSDVVVFANGVMVYYQLFIDFGFLQSATKDCSLFRNDKDKLSRIVASIIQAKTFLGIIGLLSVVSLVNYVPIFHGREI